MCSPPHLCVKLKAFKTAGSLIRKFPVVVGAVTPHVMSAACCMVLYKISFKSLFFYLVSITPKPTEKCTLVLTCWTTAVCQRLNSNRRLKILNLAWQDAIRRISENLKTFFVSLNIKYPVKWLKFDRHENHKLGFVFVHVFRWRLVRIKSRQFVLVSIFGWHTCTMCESTLFAVFLIFKILTILLLIEAFRMLPLHAAIFA